MAGSWIEWTPDLALGVEKIDNQHRELIKRFNDFAEAVFDGRGREAIGSTLQFLADYTVTHFRDEEALQELFGYPGYPRHKAIHDQFVEEVGRLKQRYDAGELDSELVVKTVDAVGAWIINHIKKEDLQIGVHLRRTREAAPKAEESAPSAPPREERPQSPPPPPPRKKGLIRRFFEWLY